MNQLTTALNQPTMSSREIAELTGKRHDNVMADIRKMLEELGIAAPEFSGAAQVPGPNNSIRTIEVFNLPKRECLILVSGYSTTLRARIIDRWQELEAQVAQQAPVAEAPKLLTPIEFEQHALATLRVVTNEDLKRHLPLIWQEMADAAQNTMRGVMGTLKALPAPDAAPQPLALDVVEIAKRGGVEVPANLRNSAGTYVKLRSSEAPVVTERLISGSIREACAYTNHAEVLALVNAYLATRS